MKKLITLLLSSSLVFITNISFSQVTDTVPTDDKVLVKFLVSDYDSIPEWGAIVHL